MPTLHNLARSRERIATVLVCAGVACLPGCGDIVSTWNHGGASTNHRDLDRALALAAQRNLADRRADEDADDPTGNDNSVSTIDTVSINRLRQAAYLVFEGDALLAATDPSALVSRRLAPQPDRLAVAVSARLAEIRKRRAVAVEAPALQGLEADETQSDEHDLPYLTLSDLGDVTPPTTQPTHPDGKATAEGITRGPLPGFGQTVWRDVRRIHRDLWDDTKRVYTNPTNLVILLTAGGASLALRPEVDDDIEDHYDRHHTMSEGWRETFGVLGNPAFHFALAGGWYLVGQQVQDIKTYEVGKTLFSALIINGVSTSALKLCACTDGPNGESFAWPSGHTSSAFTFAAVMHQSYGHWAGIPLYGLAGMVGLARLDDREHHFSDVVFGAAMGLVIGHTVAGGRRPQIFGGDVIPYADPSRGAGGIAWFRSIK